LIPVVSSRALDRSTLALTVISEPVEVIWPVFGATDTFANGFVPDFVGSAVFGQAFACAVFNVKILTFRAAMVKCSVAFASAGVCVPEITTLAGFNTSGFLTLAAANVSVEVVVISAFSWLTQTLAGFSFEVETTWTVLVCAEASANWFGEELLALWARLWHANAFASVCIPS